MIVFFMIISAFALGFAAANIYWGIKFNATFEAEFKQLDAMKAEIVSLNEDIDFLKACRLRNKSND